MEPLLPNEQKLLDCIREYFFANQCSPSIQNLINLFGKKSRSQIQKLLDQLREKGYVDWQDNQSRTYQLLVGNMPLRGVIQAGYVVEQPTDVSSYIDVSGARYKLEDYALQVQGDSMIDAHICDGDFVIIRPIEDTQGVKPGTIAAVLVDGKDTTLKYLYEEDGWVVLKAANREYETQRFEAERVQLQGILVGLHRSYEK
ncbi:MAG: repressor LexA [Leptolyngbya sp.]|nr:MAG: repressor LexA [Leptolyngbya sp.]